MSKNRASRRREAAKAKRQVAASPPPQPRLSRSRGLQAVRAYDNFHGLRSALFEAAAKKDEWAGIPMPLDGERLVVEPSYPYAAVFDKEPEPSKYDGWRLRNIWYSHQKRCEVGIMQDPDGKLHAGMMPAFHHIGHDLRTMGCSEAWGVEQEGRAVQLLGTMLRHHQFKKYLLTGMFIETSARSGVIYIFRKLKPTVALAPVRDPEGEPKILCCLCMHPIAYYADSWAGAMCPTDDVIAHLSMMRGDEHLFWKRCNQHPAYRPEAGL